MSSTHELNLTNWKGQESIDAMPSQDPMVVETVTNYVMNGELASTGFFRAMLENNFLTAVVRAKSNSFRVHNTPNKEKKFEIMVKRMDADSKYVVIVVVISTVSYFHHS